MQMTLHRSRYGFGSRPNVFFKGKIPQALPSFQPIDCESDNNNKNKEQNILTHHLNRHLRIVGQISVFSVMANHRHAIEMPNHFVFH